MAATRIIGFFRTSFFFFYLCFLTSLSWNNLSLQAIESEAEQRVNRMLPTTSFPGGNFAL